MVARPASPPDLSLERLHADYSGPLLVYALRRLRDREAAEEVVQDTLLAAWRHAHRYDGNRGTVSAWLFTIARNRTIDAARRLDRRPRTARLVDDQHPITDVEIDRVVEAWQLARALRELSADHREVIIEVHYRGASLQETAERLGIPEGTVKSRLYRGLRALRLRLEELGVIG